MLFDYGLVLSGPPDPAAWAEMQRLLGATDPAFHDAYWRYRHDYDRGALSGAAYWHRVAADLRRQPTPEELTGLLAADVALWTQPNQPMIHWATHLQNAGVRTGILSNIGDAMETGILARCSWLENFAHHTFSHRLKTAKPDPAIYAHAAQGLGVPPASILFLDDREDNILAARAFGMQAIQYLNHEDFLRDMHQAGLGALLAPATKV